MTLEHLPRFQAQAAKTEAMERVEHNACTEWKDAALKFVQHRARHCASITANDVFADLEQLGIHTHENRALGPIFRRAAQMGWIVKTDRTVPSTRKSRHCGDVRVWSSRLHQVPA